VYLIREDGKVTSVISPRLFFETEKHIITHAVFFFSINKNSNLTFMMMCFGVQI
jgi:hypothetical protein